MNQTNAFVTPPGWSPRFKLGDEVVLTFDRKRPNCRIVRESRGPWDQAGVQWGKENEWWNKCSVFESEIEAAPEEASHPVIALAASFDTDHREHAVCPHCGHEHLDSWEWFSNLMGARNARCEKCRGSMHVEKHCKITYTTTKVEPKP